MNRRDDIDAMLAAAGTGDDGFKSIVIYKLKQIQGELEAIEALLSAANEAGIIFRVKKLEDDLAAMIQDGFPDGDVRRHGDQHKLANRQAEQVDQTKWQALRTGVTVVVTAALTSLGAWLFGGRH